MNGNSSENIKDVSHREFVISWMNSKTVEDVAKALNVTVVQAQRRASYLRRLGIRLPKKTRRMTDRQLEVSQLNSLIKKYSKQ